MARLDPEIKIIIVNRLAVFDTPTQVSKSIKEDFGIDVSPQAVEAYDPTKRIGKDLSAKLKDVFESARKQFLEDISSIAISHKSVRLRAIQRMAAKSEERDEFDTAASLLEQAAKEMGEAYTNKQKLEHTGANGAPLRTGFTPTEYAEAQALLNQSLRDLD